MEEILNVYSLNRSTTEIMDEFEGYGDKNKKPYEKLCLKNVLYIFSDCFAFYVDLIIERVDSGQKLHGDISFTELKKGEADNLANYIADTAGRKTIMKVLEQIDILHSKKIQLTPPFQLRAQTSLDRSGFGKIWHGADLMYEKNFGDAKSYGITEAVIKLYATDIFSISRRGPSIKSVRV